MAYENESNWEENGDFDQETQYDEPRQHLLDDEDYAENDRPPTPVHNVPKAKPRRRLIKKTSGAEDKPDGGKRKRGKGEKRTRRKGEKIQDHEVKEMWNTVAGGDSEGDEEGVQLVDDDSGGGPPAEWYGSENEQSPQAPQAEEGEEVDEIEELFKSGKKKKKTVITAAEKESLVEEVMAELEVAAEEDHELNKQKKPAILKLKKLPLLTEALGKKHLQQEFLDHGVLTLLKNWLEPLPDKSLPNFNIRSAVLNILKDLPIDLEQFGHKEQLKKSGLGKVVMFLSKSDEEKTVNRKLAQELVDKWSRPIFQKSTRYEDMKNFEDEREVYRRPPSVKKVPSKAAEHVSRDDDLDLCKISQRQKPAQTSSRQHALRPEAMSMDFVVRPLSKVDTAARSKQTVQNSQRTKVEKKLQQMKATKRKQLQATRVSVEGRGMVKYL